MEKPGRCGVCLFFPLLLLPVSLSIKRAMWFQAVMLLCLHIFFVYQRLDTFIYHRKQSNKTLFFLFKGRNEGWMNELNEFIVLLWVSGSLGRRNRIIYCTYCRGGLINTFSIYFIHTLENFQKTDCLSVRMADLFHSKAFF